MKLSFQTFAFLFLFFVFVLSFYSCNPAINGTGDEDVSGKHNSRNSLDWQGEYASTLPCADCEGIEMVIKLSEDLSYSMETKYLGKSDDLHKVDGSFKWLEDGNHIVLNNSKGTTQNSTYQVGENYLIQLDARGNKISGESAEKYRLQKLDQEIVEKYWKLLKIDDVNIDFNFTREPHLILKSHNKGVNGHSGCNGFTGSYRMLKNNGIEFSSMAATEMACLDEQNTENRYFQVLENTKGFVHRGDTLFLNDGQQETLATFVAVYLR